MARIIRSLSSVMKTSGSTKGLGNEKKLWEFCLPSSEESSCGVVASVVLYPRAWDSVGIANTPKGSVCLDTRLWGLSFGVSSYLTSVRKCTECNFWRCFYSALTNKRVNERKSIGLCWRLERKWRFGVHTLLFSCATGKCFSMKWKEPLHFQRWS